MERSGEQRTTPRVLGVQHAQITIPRSREDEARQFYLQLLGLVEIEKPAALAGRGGFWMQAGAFPIHVGTEDGFDRNQTKAHIAYEVEGLPEWKQRLGEAGFTLLDGIPIPGYDRFELKDPFGNRLELMERLTQASGSDEGFQLS